MHALIIKEPYAGLIVDGKKDLEIRGCNTHIRGPVAIIQSGSGLIIGMSAIIKTGLLTRKDYENPNFHHGLDLPYEDIWYKKPYGWIMKHGIRFDTPLPYEHPKGAIIWIKDLRDRMSAKDYETLQHIYKVCNTEYLKDII